MMRNLTLTLLLTFSFATTFAQYNNHIVEFTDKGGTQGTIANPSAYLSAKALERRTKQNIVIDSTDLPISKAYLDSIAAVPNVTILNKSKWLNQVLIRTTDPNALVKISSFPFVRSRTAIAPRIATARDKFEDEKIGPEITARQQGIEEVQLDYGASINQIRIHKGDYLHNLGFTGRNVTIAILDAGFFGYKTNPALDSVRLQGRILGEWDYVANHASVNEDHAHGANCFTIIASNRPGIIVGSAPHSSFWLLRTENAAREYPDEEQHWAAGAEFADSAGADMISSSVGYADFDDPAFNYTHAQRNGNYSMITRAADLAAKKGMMVMNSAGNYGNLANDFKYVICPADGDSVVAVGAVDNNGNIASFSSWGPNGAGKIKPNIVSVGQGTVLASAAGNPVSGNGTSYSNPNMAGLIACFWQAFPDLNNMQILDAVQRSSHKYNNPDMRYGYGIPDFRKAFLTVLQERATFNAASANCTNTITWESRDNSTMQYRIQRKFLQDTGFITLATIPGKTEAFGKNNYVYNDLISGYSGMAQYRVQQIFSDTALQIGAAGVNVSNTCAAGSELVITLNPTLVRNNMMQFNISAPEALPNLTITITNMKGQLVQQLKKSAPIGTSLQPVLLHNLATGMYVVKVYSGNVEVFAGKIVKQ